MERRLLFLLIVCVIAEIKAQQPVGGMQQTEMIRQRLIKTNVLSPIVGTLNFHFEKRLSKQDSYQLELFYFTGQVFNQQGNVRGFGLTANYRFYLTQSFPQGWFIQPYVRYQQYWPVGYRNNNVYDRAQVASLGTVFGYQRIVGGRISLEAFAGPVYNRMIEPTPARYGFISLLNGPWLRAGATLGFLF